MDNKLTLIGIFLVVALFLSILVSYQNSEVNDLEKVSGNSIFPLSGRIILADKEGFDAEIIKEDPLKKTITKTTQETTDEIIKDGPVTAEAPIHTTDEPTKETIEEVKKELERAVEEGEDSLNVIIKETEVKISLKDEAVEIDDGTKIQIDESLKIEEEGLLIETENGEFVEVVIMPSEAIASFVEEGETSPKFDVELKVQEDIPYYSVEVERASRFLGFIPYTKSVTVNIDARNGEILSEDFIDEEKTGLSGFFRNLFGGKDDDERPTIKSNSDFCTGSISAVCNDFSPSECPDGTSKDVDLGCYVNNVCEGEMTWLEYCNSYGNSQSDCDTNSYCKWSINENSCITDSLASSPSAKVLECTNPDCANLKIYSCSWSNFCVGDIGNFNCNQISKIPSCIDFKSYGCSLDLDVLCVGDGDEDGYYVGSAPQCNDCDDNNPNVNLGMNDVCNGIDDDCDGNLMRHEHNYSTGSEICDGLDNDCDGKVDEENVCGLWLGTRRGNLQSCDINGNCVNHGNKEGGMRSMAVYDNKLWLGQWRGGLLSCTSDGTCIGHGDKGGAITSMAVYDNKLWLGQGGLAPLNDIGNLQSCSSSGNCTDYGSQGTSITSMAVYDNKLWLGQGNGNLQSCDSLGNCTNHGDKGLRITSMAVYADKLWIGLTGRITASEDRVLKSCDSNGDCIEHLSTKGISMHNLVVYDDKLFFQQVPGGPVWSHDLKFCDSSFNCENSYAWQQDKIVSMAVYADKLWIALQDGYLQSCSEGDCFRQGVKGPITKFMAVLPEE